MRAEPQRDDNRGAWEQIADQQHHVGFVRLECSDEAGRDASEALGLVGLQPCRNPRRTCRAAAA